VFSVFRGLNQFFLRGHLLIQLKQMLQAFFVGGEGFAPVKAADGGFSTSRLTFSATSASFINPSG
jgi:hypothetical protein